MGVEVEEFREMESFIYAFLRPRYRGIELLRCLLSVTEKGKPAFQMPSWYYRSPFLITELHQKEGSRNGLPQVAMKTSHFSGHIV